MKRSLVSIRNTYQGTRMGFKHLGKAGCSSGGQKLKMMRFLLCCFLLLLGISLGPNTARADDPLMARMISPKYRNAIYPTMEKPEALKIRVRIDLDSSEMVSAVLRAQLGRNGTVIREWEFANLLSEDVLVLDVGDVNFAYTRSGPYIQDDNPYEIRLELFVGSARLDVEKLELHKYPPPPAGVTEVRIDDDDNVLINGVPTLIFGAYIEDHIPATYDQLKAWGFNSARSTEGDYDDLWFFGSVAKIYATAEDLGWMRSRIQSYREDPQIIAWYVADEPNDDNVDSDTLRLIYDMARKEDPYHPAGWVGALMTGAGDRVLGILDYASTADFIGIDAYPCYPKWTYLRNVTRNFELLRDPSLGAALFEHIDIPTWGVPQMFGFRYWRWPYPQEEKNMVYQYVANGNGALFPYKYYTGDNVPMWEYWAKILIPELQSIKAAVFAPMKSGTTVHFPTDDIQVHSSDPENLIWSYRRNNEAEYLFFINTTSAWNEPLDSRVPGPKDKVIEVEVTFNEAGSESVEALIRDGSMPERYSLSGNQLLLALDGVNDQSTGVLVLRREIFSFESADINMDGIVDVLDLQLWVKISSGAETNPIFVERADVNNDDRIDEKDLQLVLTMILTR